MKILHVHDVAFVASNLVAGLQILGLDAALYEFGSQDSDVFDKKNKGLIKLYYHFVEIFKFRRFLKNNKFDIIHIHFGTFAYLAYLNKVPFYLHIHGSDIRKFIKYPILGLMIRIGIKKAKKVFITTPDLKQLILPIRHDALFLPNPVDVTLFKPTYSDLEECEYDVFSISKIDLFKGIEFIVEAIEKLLENHPNLKVVSFGFGNNGSWVNMIKRLQQKYKNLTIINRIDHKEMVDIINKSKIVLGQMSLGSLGCAEIEAMACAKPVVCKFNFGSMYPNPPPVVSVSESEDAYKKITDLLKSPDQANEIGLNARKWIIENYRTEKVAERLLGIYTTT